MCPPAPTTTTTATATTSPPEQQNICIDSKNTCNLFSSTRTINQKSIKQSVRHRSDQHNAAAAWVRGPAWSLPLSVYLAAFGC